jgi:hypothetical protein
MSKLTLQITEPTVPVLEGGTGKTGKKKHYNPIVMAGNLPVVSLQLLPVKSMLNQSEIKFMQQFLKLTDQAVVETRNDLVHLRELLWCSCDKQEPESIHSFRELNKVKNQLRKLRKVRATIASINSKLKSQSKVV